MTHAKRRPSEFPPETLLRGIASWVGEQAIWIYQHVDGERPVDADGLATYLFAPADLEALFNDLMRLDVTLTALARRLERSAQASHQFKPFEVIEGGRS